MTKLAAPSTLSLHRKRATANFFDVTGERIFIMGREKTGMGEIWVPPLRILASLQWGVVAGGILKWSGEFPPAFSAMPGGITREVVAPSWKVTEEVTCSRKEPSGLCQLRFVRLNGASGTPGEFPTHLVVEGAVEFRLMWPYPANTVGVRKGRWRKDLGAFEFRDERNLFVALLGSPEPPDRHELKRGEPPARWTASLVFDLVNRDERVIPVVVAASGRSRVEATRAYRRVATHPGETLRDQATYHSRHLDRSLRVESPDDRFNRGYHWAVVGLDRHFLHTPGIGKGYTAGFAQTTPGWGRSRPGFAWYFGRDSVWTSLAALACGDFEKVRENLKLLGDFQDISGKIFHELTLSGVVHYDAADATPLYVVLMGEYLRWSGHTRFLRTQWDRVNKAMAFLRSTIRNNHHFIENRNVGHGWVEFGPLAGSDVEIYLTACWAEALRQMAYMTEAMDDRKSSRKYLSEYETVTANMDSLFWNEETGTYDMGLCLGSSNKTDNTILPAVPILFDQLPFERSRSVASLFSGDDFSTPWGTRILSSRSSSYKGSAYHTGSVWPLFTGWCSLAEYRTHLPRAGFAHIMATLQNFRRGALGWIEEVLDGETGRPAGVCHHQAWSEAMVCLPVVRGMLGLEVDALNSWIRIRPHIPPVWSRLNVWGIRMGNRRLSVSFRKHGETREFHLTLTGNGPVTVEFEPWIPSAGDAVAATVDGKSSRIPVSTFADCPHSKITVTLKDTVGIRFMPA